MSATARYDIRSIRLREEDRTLHRFAVFADDGSRVSGFFRALPEARAARIALMKERAERARPKPRACMCCGHDFLSSGIHNRLCQTCTTGVPRAWW